MRPAADKKRNDEDLLILKRTADTKTCPGEWTLVGEHCDEGETYEATVKRALKEELGIASFDGVEVADLLGDEQSILVQTPYDAERRDLQATAIWAVRLSRRVARAVVYDREVAEAKWIPMADLRDIESCTPEITALNRVIRDKLYDAFPRRKGP